MSETDCNAHLLDIQLIVAYALGALKSDTPDKAKIAVAVQTLEKLDETITHIVFDKYNTILDVNQPKNKGSVV